MAKNKLEILVEAEVKKALGELNKVDNSVSSMKNSTQKTSSSFNSMKKSFMATAAKAGAVVGGFLAIKNSLQAVSKAYQEQEEAEKRLTSAVERNPLLDSGANERIKEFASSLQEVSTIGDETSIRLASIAASSGRTEGEIKNMVKAAADVSSALGITMDSAIRSLNKSFGGMTGELGELVPELKTLSKEQLKAGEAVDLVKKKFDGASEAMADTATGSLKQLNNAFGDYKEVLGASVMEGMKPFNKWLTKIVSNATEARKRMNALSDLLEQGLEVNTDMAENLNVEELESRIEDANKTIKELNEMENKGAGAQAKLARYESLKETLQKQLEQRKIEQKYIDMAAEGEKALKEQAEKRKKEEKEIAEQKQKQQEIINEQYKEGYSKIEQILENNKSETEKIKEDMEYISSFDWGDNSKYTKKQEEALKILQKQLEAAKNKGKEEKEANIAVNEFLKKKRDLQSEIAEMSTKAANSSSAERQYYENQLQSLKEQYNQLTKTEEKLSDYEKKVKSIQDAWGQAQLDKFSGAMSSLQGLYSAWSEMQNRQLQLYKQRMQSEIEEAKKAKEEKLEIINEEYDRSLSALKKNLENDIISREEYLERKKELDNKKQKQEEKAAAKEEKLKEQMIKKENKLKKKQFKAEKAQKIAEATMAGAQAFVQALTAGPVLGPILAASIAAMTAAQVAMISKQKFVPTKLAEGGIADKPTNAVVGEGGEPEMVMPLSKAEDYGFGGKNKGQQIVININGDTYGVEKLNEKIFFAIEKAQKHKKLPQWSYANG